MRQNYIFLPTYIFLPAFNCALPIVKASSANGSAQRPTASRHCPDCRGTYYIYNVCLRTFRAANRAELREKLAADTAAPHKSTAKLGHALPEYALHGAVRKLSLRLLPPNDGLLPPNDSMLPPNDGLLPPNEIEKRCEDEPRGIMPHEIST
ncbi:hypothetical protein [Alloprevotella tannerae]|uniref:hypothetical protein n=1 Tax=Alloprevotella tannerae TaxID=76122 RepID=UPI0028E5FFCF|nr:hypothetical protein [Alloprevotella tannerae]